jgi:hypothetical protein
LAAAILYGLMRRIRSSRMLEYMCRHNLDFLWLTEGHRPDHTTLSGFRKKSGKALKGLFRQVGRLAMAMGLVRLVEVAFDGTRVKANASRYHTWTAAKVEAAMKELDAAFERMMSEADTAHGTGENLAGMQQRNVSFLTPMESSQPQEDNPARRDDPSQPVAEADWPLLPRNAQKQLDKSCFVYVEQSQCYYCPQGRRLERAEIHRVSRNGQEVAVRVYRCANCENCLLSAACRSPKAARGRQINRDEYEPLREEMAARMQTAEGRAAYAHRMHGAETPFAHIKQALGVRQFLLRGLENVRTEWRWVCTAFNLQKLLSVVAALRARLPHGAVGAVG